MEKKRTYDTTLDEEGLTEEEEQVELMLKYTYKEVISLELEKDYVVVAFAYKMILTKKPNAI